MTSRHPKTIIIGAGIIGASIAYHLARRDAPVVIIDSGDIAGGATAKSFAWINSWSTPNKAYARLRHQSLQDYHRLQGELNGALPLTLDGALIWKADPADTERRVREQASAGYDVKLIDADHIYHAASNLRSPPPVAAFAAGEGAIEPVQAMRMLLRAAEKAGADIVTGTSVDHLRIENGNVTGVVTGKETFAADRTVIAAGTATDALAATAGISIPLEHSPALLVRFRTETPLIRRVIICPEFEIRQASDTTLLAATGYQDAAGENGPDAIAERLLATLRSRLCGADNLQLESVEVGIRPIPADDLPVVGHVPQVGGLYLAVMHSGITLAPAIGRFAAAELLDDTDIELLNICRPQRFA
ncbi:MAG: FAD-binding oxidoreductase [Pseudomonadota bacterium]